jgi:demethoxyubiquinone hydroxylase (CLK1/Coq7/Cat5 family)
MQSVGGKDEAVKRLDGYLCVEVSAVETYRQALDRLQDARVRNELRNLLRSHQERCDLLRQRIVELGGAPSRTIGLWDAFARLVDGTGRVFGVGPALAALQQGEEQGLKEYRRDLSDLDAESQELIRSRILPEQERTFRAIATLQQTVPA